jgi:hypothetical protein
MHRVVAEFEGFRNQDTVILRSTGKTNRIESVLRERLFAEYGIYALGFRKLPADIRVGYAPRADDRDVDFFVCEHAIEFEIRVLDLKPGGESIDRVLGEVTDGDEVGPIREGTGCRVCPRDAPRADQDNAVGG